MATIEAIRPSVQKKEVSKKAITTVSHGSDVILGFKEKNVTQNSISVGADIFLFQLKLPGVDSRINKSLDKLEPAWLLEYMGESSEDSKPDKTQKENTQLIPSHTEVTEPTEPAEPYIVTIINRTDAVEKSARRASEQQVRAKQRKGNPWNPIHWPRKLRFKFGEEFYRQRGIQRARDAIVKNDNTFIQMDTIKNKVLDEKSGQQADKAEARAKIEQIVSQDNPRQGIAEIAQSQVKELLSKEIFRPIIEGTVTTEKEVQDMLRNFVVEHQHNPNLLVRRQIKKIFGSKATQFGRTAEYFATDILEIGNLVKNDQQENGWPLDELNNHIDFRLANTNWGADTAPYMNRVDKWIIKNRSENAPFIRKSLAAALARRGIVFNEAIVGALASVGTFFTYRGIARAVAALSTGIGAGFFIGATQRNRNLKLDMASHRTDHEYGAQTSDLTRKVTDFIDTRKKLERYRYDLVSSNDLLHGNADRDDSLYTQLGLNDLLKADVSTKENRQQLIHLLAETQERLSYSAKEKVGLIQYSSEQEVEQERLTLIKKVTEGIEHLVASGMTETQVAQAIKEQMSRYEKHFADTSRKQDKRFRRFRFRSSITMGLFGGAVGFATGLATQQGIAEISRATGHPTKSTLIEEWSGHKQTSDQTQNVIADALQSHKTSGRIGDVTFHIDKKGDILFDVPGKSSTVGAVYHPDNNTLVFQGDIRAQFPEIYDQLQSANISTDILYPKYTTSIADGWKWFNNGTAAPDHNELLLYDARAGHNGVKFDMTTMTQNGSSLNGQYIDVSTLMGQNKAVFAFWNPQDPNHPILVRAQDGILSLNKSAQTNNTVEVWMNNGWKKVPNADIAHTVLGELGNFKDSSEANNQEWILKYNVSAVALDDQGRIVDSFASIHGQPSASEQVTTILHLPNIPKAPEGQEAAVVALPFTPRRPLRSVERQQSERKAA